MSNLTVGRAMPIDNARIFSASGDDLNIAGVIPTNDITLAKVYRQQLLGYVDNPDALVIPVTYAGDSTIDGFYIVRSAKVEVGPGNLKIGYFPYDLQLTRVGQYSLPLIEAVFLGAVRTNAIAFATEDPWMAVPSVHENPTFINGTGFGSPTGTRTSADGVLTLYTASAPGSVDHDCKVQYLLAPANFYIGAALLETGTTLRTVVGKQIVQTPSNWRLSNGLIRVIPDVSGGTLRLSISPYDGTQWDTATVFKLWDHTAGAELTNTNPQAITVLRNSPEEVIIRISFHFTGYLDLLLRRGSRLVYGYLTTGLTKLGIIPSTTVAATALTGGLRKTTNDAGGNRLVIASPSAVTKDLATGEVYLTAAGNPFNFAVGFEVPGAASAYDAAQALVNQYFAADTERMTVVNR